MTGVPSSTWSVVMPVKLLRSAKTRLGPLAPAEREALAMAMALDTVTASLASSRVGAVFVVSDDRAAAVLHQAGAVVIPDTPNAGLNAALEHGAAEARRRQPDAWVVALTADLPALKPDELSRSLDAAAAHARAVVADASGDGTVALTAAPGVALDPSFGGNSLERHTERGALPLDVYAPGLRRDVDTVDDLRQAMRLGCGSRTTAAAASVLRAVASRQATVRDFDQATHAGTVLLDDGTALLFDGEAFGRGGLRSLRPGQRVRIALAADPESAQQRVTVVTLATFDLPEE